MLPPIPIPGLFVTGTDTGVGKTVIAGAIARWFRMRGQRVSVSKPVASGCPKRREGLVSEDAEFLAHCADARHPLDVICPQRYAEPLAPAVAAEREKRPLDWESVRISHALMSQDSQVMLVEGVGGICVPLDDRHTVLDMAQWLKKPAIVVARANLGTINHTVMTVKLLQNADVKVAGVVINRYPAENASVAEETSPRMIEKWAKVPVLCIVPEEPLAGALPPGALPPGVIAAVAAVDWTRLVG